MSPFRRYRVVKYHQFWTTSGSQHSDVVSHTGAVVIHDPPFATATTLAYDQA